MRIGSDFSYQITPQGSIDEVRLWSVARTQAQIRKELIDQTIADGKRLGKAQSEIDAEIANINAKHKDSKPAAVRRFSAS